MNRFGYKLADLSIIGYSEEEELQSSVANTCRGKVHYQYGATYVFEVVGFSDCGTISSVNATHTTYKSRIQGVKEMVSNEQESIDETVVIDFQCAVLN